MTGIAQRLEPARRLLPGVLATLLLVGVLLPITASGMRGDDSHVTVDFEGARALSGAPITEFVADEIAATLDAGRAHVLGAAGGTLYALTVPERLPYKAGIALAALAAFLALLAFLRAFGPPRGTLLVAVAAIALSLQFRHTHDPALGYYGTQQVSVLLLVGGLAAYLRFLRGGGTRWYAATLLLVVLFLLNYEANPPLVLAFACLHLGHDPRRTRSWRPVVPIIAAGAAMTLLSFVLRLGAPAVEGYEASPQPVDVLLTAVRQALSGLPGIYALAGSDDLLLDATRPELLAAGWRALLAAAVVWLAFRVARGGAGRPDGDRASSGATGGARDDAPWGALPVAAMGAVLMALSGAYISLGSQHQEIIGLGGGHLATFSGTTGFAMLAAGAWMRWAPAAPPRRAVTAAVTGAVLLLAFATQYANVRVVAVERAGIEQRELLAQGLDRGVLAGLEDGTTVYVSNRDLDWSLGRLYSRADTLDHLVHLRTGRRLDVKPAAPAAAGCGAPSGFPVHDCAEASARVGWLAVRASPGGGSVVAASGIPRDRVADRSARRLVVAARDASRDGAAPLLVGTRPDGTPWSARDARWERRELGGGWTRYTATLTRGEGPVAASVTDPRSPVDFSLPRTAGELVRMFGTRHVLP